MEGDTNCLQSRKISQSNYYHGLQLGCVVLYHGNPALLANVWVITEAAMKDRKKSSSTKAY